MTCGEGIEQEKRNIAETWELVTKDVGRLRDDPSPGEPALSAVEGRASPLRGGAKREGQPMNCHSERRKIIRDADDLSKSRNLLVACTTPALAPEGRHQTAQSLPREAGGDD